MSALKINKKRTTLLIVDDVQDNRAILAALFEKEYAILEAADGVEALDILSKEYKRISIVILDIKMPNMDGFAVLQAMKKKKEFFEIPVVVISALNEIAAEVKALEMGASDFIVKPFDARIVIPRIHNLVIKREYESIKLENIHLREEAHAQKTLQIMLNTVPGGIGIFELKDDGNLTMILGNEGLFSMLGYSHSKKTADFFKNFASVVYPVDLPKLACFNKVDRKKLEPFSVNVRVLQNNGAWMWTMITAKPILSTQGTLHFYALLVDVSDEEMIKAELQYQAEYDKLTGIYNEEAFYRLTRKMLDENQDSPHVIVCWNIERFKLIGDLVGSETSDLVLKIFADVLRKEMIKNMGTYGRLEADHFAICLQYALFDEKIFQMKLQESFAEYNLQYPVTLAAGIYLIEDRSMPISLMCDRATLALQTIQGNYHRHYAFYDTSLRETMIMEQEVRNDMKSALLNREFVIYMQPIYSLTTGAPVSAETLVRWKHPQKGIIPPDKFIPVFEQSGFIAELDRYVWEEVCKYLKDRKSRGLPDFPISLNVSRASLYSMKVFDVVTNLVKKYDIAPKLFRIEITESAYSDNPDQFLSTISDLQKFGFTILMDDFGSGYSSLNTLKDIPVDILKVDMKFIESIEVSNRARNILASVVRMAVRLGLPVIMEGVETKEQIDFLASIGCDTIQGYYFAYPMLIEDFERHLSGKVPVSLPAPADVHLRSEEINMLLGDNILIDRILNGIGAGIALCELADESIEILRINRQYYRVFELDSAAFKQRSMNFLDNIDEDDRPRFVTLCKNVITNEMSDKITVKCYKPDKSLMSINLALQYLGKMANQSIMCMLSCEKVSVN